MNERFVKELMSAMNCGICGQHFEIDNINVLGHEDDIWFLNIFCRDCHTQALVVAVIKEGSPPEIITDLTKAELAKFAQASPVSNDDVLNLHIFLDGFDGDFVNLFNQNDKAAT